MPIVINIAPAEGTLKELCTPSLKKDQARIEVESSVVNLCIGGFPSMDANPDSWNGSVLAESNMCIGNDPGEGLSPHEILRVLDFISIKANVGQSIGITSPEERVTLTAAPPSPDATETVGGNVDIDLEAILTGLLGGLKLEVGSGGGSDIVNQPFVNQLRQSIAKDLTDGKTVLGGKTIPVALALLQDVIGNIVGGLLDGGVGDC